MGESWSRDAAIHLHRLTDLNDNLSACAFARVWRKARHPNISKAVMSRVKKRAMDEATGLSRIRRRHEQDENAVLFNALEGSAG